LSVERRAGRPRTLAAGALSGLIFALAFPPLEWVLLLPLALVPWLVTLVREESRGRALVSGFLFGLVYWCASIPWIVYVVTHYGGQNGLMGVVCLIILAAILAEWPAIVAWATVASAPAGSIQRLALFPLLWMASEHARSFVYKGFPWNLTGHALYRHPVWIQSASVWGVYGLGLAVVSLSALVAAGVSRRSARPVVVAALLVGGLGFAGSVRLARPSVPSRALSVALLQPNIKEEARRTAGLSAEAYRAVIDQAMTAREKRPWLIVIPESALAPLYWQESDRLRRDLAEIVDDCCHVLFNDVEEEEGGRYYNVARLLGPKGLLGAAYRKVHLVPFGEYVPLPKLFFFVRQISTTIGEFSAAPAPRPLEAEDFRIGMGVCYEILYPDLVRREVSQGAKLLVTISNDSWYGRAGAQAQHFAGAVIRTVETNRYLLRAAITGITGIVDEKGRIRGELHADEAGIAYGTADLFDIDTLWTRWGFWLPRATDVLALSVLFFGAFRSLRERRASRARPRAKS
jgi:apolipoprotein N-acyltransferase